MTATQNIISASEWGKYVGLCVYFMVSIFGIGIIKCDTRNKFAILK